MAFVFNLAAENREFTRLAEIGQLPVILRDPNLAGIIADFDGVGASAVSNAFSEVMKLSEPTKLAAGLLENQAPSLAGVAALDLDIPSPAEEVSKMLSGSAMTGMAGVVNREMTEFSAGLQALEESQCFGRSMLDALSAAAELEKISTGVTDIIPREIAKVSAGPWALDESRITGRKMLDEFSGMSALSQLAAGMFDHAPFDNTCTTAMRRTLGDWRQITEFPTPLLDAPLARSDFYFGLGFDRALMDMPTPAYMATLDAIVFRAPQSREPVPYRHYLPECDESADGPDDTEAVPHLNRKAYRKLYIVETSLRSFIDPLMCATYGPAWLRERMHELHDRLQEKCDKDIATGRDPAPLIAYADFTDYRDIIVRRTHWNDIFSSYFPRKDDISESLIRLYPARNCTMHGRVVTKEDYLLVVVEVNRILKAIKRTRH